MVPQIILFPKNQNLEKQCLEYPLLIVVEAKKNDFEQGWAQCLSELIAAKNLNQSEKSVYGIVTDGKLWEFGKLNGCSQFSTTEIDCNILGKLENWAK